MAIGALLTSNAALKSLMRRITSVLTKPFGYRSRATRLSTLSAAVASATAPISVGKARLISLASTSMWIRAVSGMLNVKSRYHELLSASLKRVPIAKMTSAARHVSLTSVVPQNPVIPNTNG